MDTFFKDIISQFDILGGLKHDFHKFKVAFEKSIEVEKKPQENQMELELLTFLKDTKRNYATITKMLIDIVATIKLQKDNGAIVKLQKDIPKLHKDIAAITKLQKDVLVLKKLQKDIPAILKLLKNKGYETTKPMSHENPILKEIVIEIKKVFAEMKMLKENISKQANDLGQVREELHKLTWQSTLLMDPKQVPQPAIRFEVPKPKIKRYPAKMISSNTTIAKQLKSTVNTSRFLHNNFGEADSDLSISDISLYEPLPHLDTTFRKAKPYKRPQSDLHRRISQKMESIQYKTKSYDATAWI